MRISARKMALAAVVAAMYAGLTMFLAPISYGPIQMRVSEVLCILPFFFPFSVWGLFVGCVLANLLSAYGIVDVVFGSMASLLAALCTMYIGRLGRNRGMTALACLPPVVFNGLLVGAAIAIATTNGGSAFWPAYAISGIEVAASEFLVMFALAFPLALYLPRAGFFNKLIAIYGDDL